MPHFLVIVSVYALGVIESWHFSEAQKMTEANFSCLHLGNNCIIFLLNLSINPEYVR